MCVIKKWKEIKEAVFQTMCNHHEDACLLSTQITLQAVYHEIWGKR